MKEILSILNPVRLLTVSDWMEVAKIILQEKTGGYLEPSTHLARLNDIYIKLIQRFEELTYGKWVKEHDGHSALTGKEYNRKVFQPTLLTKEMFVNSVEKPDASQKPVYGVTHVSCAYYHEEDAYNQRVERFQSAQEKVWFSGNKMIWGNAYSLTGGSGKNPTVFDFIFKLDEFNRTAKEPIKINWTEFFVKETEFFVKELLK